MAKKPVKSAGKSGGRALGELREQVFELPELPKPPAPLTLGQILGQERAVDVLERAIRARKVHHAWIFEGPFGVGKFTAALAFAALLLDDTTAEGLSSGIAADPDSKTQVMLRAGSHPDIAIINKELARHHSDSKIRDSKQRAISVDVVREFVLEHGGIAGSAAGKDALAAKVFIVDEAELLNVQAQNALLKFLEEPPARTVLMLVCNAAEELLPTIRSRCQRVVFSPMPDKAMQAWLKSAQAGDEEQGIAPFEIDVAQKKFLMDFAQGSPGALVRCSQTGIGAWWGRIEPMLAQVDQGKHVVEFGPAMTELVDSWAKAWVEDNENASKEAANHQAAAWMLKMLAWHYTAKLKRASKDVHSPQTARVLEALDAIRAAEWEVDVNVNMIFVFDKLAAVLAAGGSAGA